MGQSGSVAMSKQEDECSDPKAPATTLSVGDSSISATLRRRLREDIPERRAQFAAALASDPIDMDALAGHAHRLAGAAAYCGQETLQEAAVVLEGAARLRHPETVREAWHKLCELLRTL